MGIALFTLINILLSFSANQRLNLNKELPKQTHLCACSSFSNFELNDCHNGDYELLTPDSLAFDDLCFFEAKYYNSESISGYMKYSKNNSNYYSGCEGSTYYDNIGNKLFRIYCYEEIDRFNYLNYFLPITGKNSLLVSGNIYRIDLDSSFISDDISVLCHRQNAEISNTIDSYIPYNSSEKPNFLRIVSYDPNTNILKARFRITFQVINPFDGNKYIGATLGGIGKKRNQNSPEFVTLDDGVIHIYLQKY